MIRTDRHPRLGRIAVALALVALAALVAAGCGNASNKPPHEKQLPVSQREKDLDGKLGTAAVAQIKQSGCTIELPKILAPAHENAITPDEWDSDPP
jgi:hypothetical protein